MISQSATFSMSSPLVFASSNGGHSPDAIAEMCVNKLISVSEGAPPEIREQALALRGRMLMVVRNYITMAVQEDRKTVSNKVREAGFSDLAEQLRRM